MADENKKQKLPRGVIVEFDFTALNGAEILFQVAKKQLAACGIDLTVKLEAMHLVNGNCQGALAELFGALDKQEDPAKAAREIMDAFRAELSRQAAGAFTPGFKAFVNALTAKGLRVIISTRAEIEGFKALLADFDRDLVSAYSEPSQTYGNCKWDAWRRSIRANDLHEVLTVAVTGSGYGVKAALVAGMSAIAVIHDHVAYQDFGGADCVAEEFNAALADEVVRMLHLEA